MANELYHHGIEGQRWGVRRFQNPDGTLTAAGKQRYGERYGQDFDDAELKRAVDRMKLEADYRRYNDEINRPDIAAREKAEREKAERKEALKRKITDTAIDAAISVGKDFTKQILTNSIRYGMDSAAGNIEEGKNFGDYFWNSKGLGQNGGDGKKKK